MHRYNYDWNLENINFTKDQGNVFSCFACGGGSTMGYKLAGFNVLGCNEIDPKMISAYRKNHKPKYSFLEPIQDFKNRKDLPEELYNLDILDGSPPCSSFSISGNRGKDWGKQKKFREGQALQVLDTLFFDFIDLAEELQPKVVVSENVKGLLLGDAKDYVEKIYKAFDKAGYYCQHKLLNAKTMGVPQNRERVFFVCLRKDLANKLLNQKDLFNVKPYINLDFNETNILWENIIDEDDNNMDLSPLDADLWDKKRPGDTDLSDISIRERNILSRFNAKFLYKHKCANTITGGEQCVLYDKKRKRNHKELIQCSSFPSDYDFEKNKPSYMMGMSVPPIMIAQIVDRINTFWLRKLL